MAPITPARPAAHPIDVAGLTASWSRRVVAVLLVVGVAVGLFGIAGTGPVWSAPVVLVLAVAGFVLGMPHGAVDHVLLSRLAGRPLVPVTAVYALTALAVWMLLRWTGPVALLVVVVLSVVHFGLGELEVYRDVLGWRPRPAVATAAALAACGALLLPLARSGDQIRDVASALAPGLGDIVGSGPVRTGLVVGWIVAAGVAGTAAVRAGRASVLLDIALVGALGALLPPLVAFAVWFGGWHALRHTGRLLTVEPGCAALVAAGSARAAVGRLARMALLPSIGAVTVLGVIAALTATAPDLTGAVAEALRVLLALTVPHMLVVLWLDRRPATAHG